MATSSGSQVAMSRTSPQQGIFKLCRDETRSQRVRLNLNLPNCYHLVCGEDLFSDAAPQGSSGEEEGLVEAGGWSRRCPSCFDINVWGKGSWMAMSGE